MGATGRVAVAALVSVAMAAAACGGDGGESASDTTAATEAGGGEPTTTAEPTTTSAPPVVEPSSMEEWEELWAEERRAVVERIQENGWGKSADGSTLTGPAGFTIDLSACPAGWSDTEGLTDTEIKIGAATPLSGTAADAGNWTRGADTWFRYRSEQGGFEDSTGKTRTINFLYKDDAYDAARTIPIVDELLDSERVFALWTVGTPSGLKIYDKVNERCVPHPVLISGSPAWGDPVNHPWTTGSLLSYNTEAVIWGAFIDDNFEELSEGDGEVLVAGFVANSEFGATYESAFRAVIEDSPNRDKIEFITERVEITAPTVTDPMTTIASQHPDVFITMTGATHCPQIINEAANNGMKEEVKALFMSSVCKASSYVGKEKVGGDGSASDGWYIVGGGFKDFNAEALDDDPFVAFGRELLAEHGYDYRLSGSFGQGFYFGWLWTQSLLIAGELDGGLTRSNLMLAQRAFEGTSPVHLPGIRINMNGNEDAFFLEGSDLSVWDSETQRWILQGDVIELSGRSRTCAWDVEAQTCR